MCQKTIQNMSKVVFVVKKWMKEKADVIIKKGKTENVFGKEKVL